jgi:hypothetical protein
MDHLKLISDQQAKAKHAYKNAKEKIRRTSAAIWLNKMFQLNYLTSVYINNTMNGHKWDLPSVFVAHAHHRNPHRYVRSQVHDFQEFDHL